MTLGMEAQLPLGLDIREMFQKDAVDGPNIGLLASRASVLVS